MKTEQFTEEALGKVMSWLETSEVFVTEQAPLLAQEIVSLGYWMSAWGVVIGTVLIGIGVIVGYFTVTAHKRKIDIGIETIIEVIGGFVGVGSVIVGFCMSVCSIETLIKITFAPRLYLLQELQKLL